MSDRETPQEESKEWASFREYLASKHRIQKQTGITYASQVRRILGEVGELTTPNLNKWVGQFVASQRTPFRASWRKFRMYYKDKYGIDLPDFSRIDGNNVTPELLEALRVCVQGHKVRALTLCALTTQLDTGPRFAALSKTMPGVQSGALVLVISAEGHLTSIPVEAYRAFLAWGQQSSRAGQPHWLIPNTPGGDIAMSASQIGKLLKANP